MPQNELAIFWSAKKRRKDIFSHPPSTFPSNFVQLQQWWHLYCFAILSSTCMVTHSVKQRLLRNRPGSDAATSRDFLRERLQRAFTCANQLHWTTQYIPQVLSPHPRTAFVDLETCTWKSPSSSKSCRPQSLCLRISLLPSDNSCRPQSPHLKIFLLIQVLQTPQSLYLKFLPPHPRTICRPQSLYRKMSLLIQVLQTSEFVFYGSPF